MEEWRPVPEHEGRYEVSNLGRIRSFVLAGGQLTDAPRIMSTWRNHDGYLRVGLVRATNETQINHFVHRLVCRAFHGEPGPLKIEAAHIDGNRANARADNLKWATKIENHGHKRLHGTHGAGERHPRAKLTEKQVLAIRASNARYGIIAAAHGISWHTVSDIKRGLRWKHLLPDAA